MILLTTLAFAHPDHHGDGLPTRAAEAAAPAPAQKVGPPVPASYSGIVAGIREQAAHAETASKDWKVADLLHASDNLQRFARSLPVRAMAMPEDERLIVTARTKSLVAHADTLKSTIAERDLEVLNATLASIRSDLDALPAGTDSAEHDGHEHGHGHGQKHGH
jgi:hypothetical protein